MADAIVFNDDGSVTAPLSKGYVTTLDAEDFVALFVPGSDGQPTRRWYALEEPSGPVYAVRTESSPRRMVWLHREICRPRAGLDVDHIDNNGLNNRRANLREATRSQNLANRSKSRGRGRFKGVYWDASRGLWQAMLRVNGKNRHLGRFADEVEAAKAYNIAAFAAWGEFATVNPVTDD